MVAWRMTSADRFCPAMCKILVCHKTTVPAGPWQSKGWVSTFDALDDGVVVAAGLAFCQVFVRVLFAFEKGLPLIAPDPAVAARPHGEAPGVGREVVDVGCYLQSPAAVAGTVGMGTAIFQPGRRAVGQGAIQAARPLAVEPHRAGLG